MQVKGAKQVHYDSGPNMTPLVDVVLVILIFMMLVGKFGGNEHYLSSTVPITDKGSGEVKDSPIPDMQDLRIRVDALGDRFSAHIGSDMATDKATLTALLRGKLQQFQAAGTPADKVQVIIEPARTIKYMYLIQVYESALDAEFPKIAITTSHS